MPAMRCGCLTPNLFFKAIFSRHMEEVQPPIDVENMPHDLLYDLLGL